MNKKLIIFCFILSSITTKKSFSYVPCPPGISGLKREIPLEVTPTYFIRVDTNSRKIFLSGDCTISLDTGKCLTKGETFEPYPVSGHDLLTIPHCNGKSSPDKAPYLSMCFYNQKTYQNMNISKPIFEDKELYGYYQSVGFLNRKKEESKIRIITYYGFMRDYLLKNGQIKPLGKVIKHCKDLDNKLPMLSKDGKIISAWNLDTKKPYCMI
ncbi:MAG: hypothetical protein V4596_00725 [Bdellovibrionota bacterium]